MPPGRSSARRAALAAVLVTTAALGACGSSDEPASSSDRSESGPSLAIRGFRFDPNPLVVPVGTRVEVANNDDAAHTATAEDKSFDTGNLGPGAEKQITLSTPGEIAYICSIHNYMRGVIRVGG